MTYHLYDDNRRHLAMSDSLRDLEAAAVEMIAQGNLPYAYLRWTDAAGKAEEMRISAESLAAAAGRAMPSVRHTARNAASEGQRKARRRAAWITNGMIVFLLLYIVGEIAAIVTQARAPS